MMNYETWLELRRDNPQDKELQRVGKLKTIKKAEAHTQHLREWLAGRVTLHYIDSLEQAQKAVEVLSQADVLALDIETAKTDPDPPAGGPESQA